MKNIGIWLDKQKAYIITLADEGEICCTIFSNVEDFHVSGGAGTRLKGGPQDVVQDRKYLEREKHQLKAYFKNIVEEIMDADHLVLFGPAETYEKFKRELITNYHELSKKISATKNADSMTPKQTVALVRDYFNNYDGK